MRGRRWATMALAVGLGAIVVLVGREQLAAAWSNHCDPGNKQFELLKHDPVVGFRASGELFTWENDGPDNGFTCANPTLSVNHVGQDLDGMLAEAKADMTDGGWTAIDLGGQGRPDFYIYEKVASGVRLSAVVLRNAFWVEVDLSAPGLHPGSNGF